MAASARQSGKVCYKNRQMNVEVQRFAALWRALPVFWAGMGLRCDINRLSSLSTRLSTSIHSFVPGVWGQAAWATDRYMF